MFGSTDMACALAEDIWNITKTILKWVGIVAIVGLVVFVCFIIPAINQQREQQKEIDFKARAVEMGYAQYSTDAGKFYWKNKDVEYLIEGKK